MTSARRSVAELEGFEDALKKFGINDLWLRQWIIRLIDSESASDRPDAWRAAEIRRAHTYWIPPSGGYLAVGYLANRDDSVDPPTPAGWRRSAVITRTSVRFPDYREDRWGETVYRWETVPFPHGAQTRRGGRRPAAADAVCPTCFIQVPASGVCDNCG